MTPAGSGLRDSANLCNVEEQWHRGASLCHPSMTNTRLWSHLYWELTGRGTYCPRSIIFNVVIIPFSRCVYNKSVEITFVIADSPAGFSSAGPDSAFSSCPSKRQSLTERRCCSNSFAWASLNK